MIRPTLYIMAKAPIMGRAKTRLAADIGVVHAKRIYRQMMSTVIRQTNDPRWDTVLMVTPPLMLGCIPEWKGLEQVAQVPGTLSPKLAQIFVHKGSTVVIGTDCPQVSALDIAAAFRALKSSSSVFGPASDGGFWLMGAKAPLPSHVFEGIRWSSEHTLTDIQSKLGKTAVMRTLTDVDDLAALKASRQMKSGR